MNIFKLLSPSVFILIIFCFLLPFISVSCGGSKIATVSGYGLACGTRIDSGFGKSDRTSPDINALLILGSAIAGFVFSLVKVKSQKLIKFIVTILGFILLVFLMIRTSGDIDKEGYMFTANFEYGIYAVFLLFLVAIYITYKDFTNKEEIDDALLSYIPEIICPSCKVSNNSTASFCNQCGSKLNIGEI